jgi:hypothetical protein
VQAHRNSGSHLLSATKYGQEEILWNLPDVVLHRQKAMHMPVNHHPAVALRIGTRTIEGPGGFGQLLDQLGIVFVGGFHGQNHGSRSGQQMGQSGRSAERSHLGRGRWGGVQTLTAAGSLAAFVTFAAQAPSIAQAPSPNQPEAIPERRGLTLPPCPWIGPPGTIQPLRIQPRQVGAKNARGCLSAEDAVYGPDGCPVRFCGTRTPRLQLPAP